MFTEHIVIALFLEQRFRKRNCAEARARGCPVVPVVPCKSIVSSQVVSTPVYDPEFISYPGGASAARAPLYTSIIEPNGCRCALIAETIVVETFQQVEWVYHLG